MLWIKAFHIISVITWFAALFYLPRLFVYHAMSDDQVSINPLYKLATISRNSLQLYLVLRQGNRVSIFG
jgi:uncharacterized membrane protein